MHSLDESHFTLIQIVLHARDASFIPFPNSRMTHVRLESANLRRNPINNKNEIGGSR